MPINDDDIVMRLEFETSSNEISSSRSVYTLLDFLGDVGGLLDMCIIIAKIVWTIIFAISGSEINRYLVGNLFFKDARSSTNSTRSENSHEGSGVQPQRAVKAIKNQRPFKPKRCLCFLSVCDVNQSSISHIRRLKKGEDKIAK